MLTTSVQNSVTFGVTPSEHKNLKNHKRQTLRDHFTDLELIFSMLGEAATTEIVQTNDPQGFIENKKVAKIAGDARKELEKLIGQLSEALQKVPEKDQEQAEAVAETAKSLVDTAKAEKPKKTMI